MAHPQTNFSSNFQGVDPPLEGYWHDDPIPCGGGNVVTDIWPNPAGVPVVVKGFNALTTEDIVDKLDKTGDASNTTSTFTKASGDTSTITSGSKLSAIFTAISSFFASVASALGGKLDKTGDASNTTATFAKASGDTSTMTSGSKLSAIFTAISSFFASLKALAFKDKASYNDLSSGVQSSLDKADTALQSHQSVTDNNPTLVWETTSKVGSVGSTDLQVTMPSNPATIEEIGSTPVDLNALTASDGRVHYYFWSNGNRINVSNKPSDAVYTIQVIMAGAGSAGTYVMQIAYRRGTTDIYVRRRSDGSVAWSAWTNIHDASWITGGVPLKTNTATLYISGYYNIIPVYHVKDIKNGCVNYVHVKDTSSSSCNLTIEAPTLAAGEEYDYVVVFDTFTNNNLVGNIDVENCKTTGHFESGVFVHDAMAISSVTPSQVPMIIVTGNVARPQWYDRT